MLPNRKPTFIKKIKHIFPSYIDTRNSKYLEIDNMYYAHLLAVNFARVHTDLLLEKIISNSSNINISMFYEKQDTLKTLKDLTYHIGNVGADIRITNNNSQDIDCKVSTLDDAKYIRKHMQVDKEELFNLYLYFCIYNTNKESLNKEIEDLESRLLSQGIYTRRANFRQVQAFYSSLPIMQNSLELKEVTKRNVLTDSLVATYPFISSQIYDENGILYGFEKEGKSPIIVDLFNNKKYKNANVCVFGTSGSGKSYFAKLLVLRNAYLNIKQFVIDPDREYVNICKQIGGSIVKIGPKYETYINILDIRQEDIDYDTNKRFSRK